MVAPARRLPSHALWAVPLLACVLTIGAVLIATPAWAHGDGETQEGYLLVQQALGHLAHDTSMAGIDLAMEKVDDALATKDQEGVDVAEVTQAKSALDAGNVVQARSLLQQSITEAMGNLMPAVGEETGTKVVPSAQPGRGSIELADWVAMAGSALLVFLGGGLAWRYRPRDNVHELGRSLRASTLAESPDKPGTDSEDPS